MKLKRPQLVPHSSVVKLFQAAKQAWGRSDFQQSFELLERASRLDPANPNILLQLGRSHGLRYNYAAAEECFERAVRVAPRKTEMLIAVGIHSRDFHNPELAERYFRRAAEQKDAPAEALVCLAEFYERLRRTDEAAQAIDRALQLDRNFPRALLTRAQLERQAGHLEEAERLLRSLLPQADQETRIRANYQLGAVLDAQGHYDEAMTAFVEAKAPLQPSARQFYLQRQIAGADVREMLARVSAEIFQRWFDFAQELQPRMHSGLALLCGHLRSGTTLLEQVLDAHPDVISAEETDIFYDEVYVPLARAQPPPAPRPGLPPQLRTPASAEWSVLETVSTESLRQSRENYFRRMELCVGQPIGSRLLIDKNPALTLLPRGFVRVFPETKLLVALRDPRDVCLSCFMQCFVPLNPRHAAFLNLKDTVEEYVEDMNIWQTLAPMMRGHYLEVRYEDLVDDLESVARKTLDFLGVTWDAQVLSFYERARQKRVRTPSYAEVTRPIFKTAKGRWRNYQKYLEPFLPKLEPLVKAFSYE